MTPQNPLGVAGRAVPEEDEDDLHDDDAVGEEEDYAGGQLIDCCQK